MKKNLKILITLIILIILFVFFIFIYKTTHPKIDNVGINTNNFQSYQAEAKDTFNMETDYSALIIESIHNGNYECGREYEKLRKLKLDCMGLSDNLNFDDLLLLSKIVHAEAGSSWISEEHRQLVASVVVNRVESSEFPNSIYDVAHQPGQYSAVGTQYFNSLVPSETSVKSAFNIIMSGSIAPPDVVFQSGFKQGSGIYKKINDNILGTTYFCYSNNRHLYQQR